MITLQQLPKTPAAPSVPAAAHAGAPEAGDADGAIPGFASLLAGLKADAGDASTAPGTPAADDKDAPAPAAPVTGAAAGEVQAAMAMVASMTPASTPADKAAGAPGGKPDGLAPKAIGREPEGIKTEAPLRAEQAGAREARAPAQDAHATAPVAIARDAREPAVLADPVHAMEQPAQSPVSAAPQLATFAQHYRTEPVALPAPVDAPIGSARWGEQLATQVVVLVRDGTQAADIRITPPELGPVHARISVDDGVATVMLSAPAHETRDALEAALPALRDVLAESGIQLGESAVSEERYATQRDAHPESSLREATEAKEGAGELQGGFPRGQRQRAGLLDLYA